MATWKQAQRFAGDTLLLSDGPGAAGFECGPTGWHDRSNGAHIEPVRLIRVVGDEHWQFVWKGMLRAQLEGAQRLVDRSAASLLGQGTLVEVADARLNFDRIAEELSDMATSRSKEGKLGRDPLRSQ